MDEAKLNLLIKVAVTELPPGADHTADTLCAIYHALVDGFNLEPEDVMRTMMRFMHDRETVAAFCRGIAQHYKRTAMRWERCPCISHQPRRVMKG